MKCENKPNSVQQPSDGFGAPRVATSVQRSKQPYANFKQQGASCRSRGNGGPRLRVPQQVPFLVHGSG